MSFTPDQPKKVGLGIVASPAPFFTPRPERRRTDPRGIDGNTNRQDRDRDREVNVQVILRCRPLSDDEQKLNIPKVISCNEQRREVTVLQSISNKQVDRVFTFDKVFGPRAQQRSIYDQAISPIVSEVLEGFNCTVFAHGQTGTGKTYTMEGGLKTKNGELSAEAGVIPRAVRQIFDTLEVQKADYSMKVSFFELYNEEIIDLLAPEDYPRTQEDKQKKPISLMEDAKGCVIVRGLEEEVVYTASDIHNLLERGSSKRRTADTLLNKHSSRAHSIFSITIHVKEATGTGEEIIKYGRLNLVDLAGSENISRSGAREVRAREAGEINKSLLTLGRVINALVEHSGHIPYRDSKLTRLLRDSLGGKTKTCIIATISPSARCLEETLSTLDHAFRAKSIRNKPEANQKMSKTLLLKDLYLEIEKMKEDVRAAREKNGVYVPHERFVQEEANKKAMIEKVEQLEIDLDLGRKQVNTFRELYLREQETKLNLEYELQGFKKNLENCIKDLQDLQHNHKMVVSTLNEKEFIISKLLFSENSIIERAKELRANLQNASEDVTALFAKLDRKNRIESENQDLILKFGSQLDQSLKNLHKTVLGSVSQQQQQLRCMEEHVCSFIASKHDASKVLELRISKMKETYTSGMEDIKKLARTLEMRACSNLEEIKSTNSSQIMAVENFLTTAVLEAEEVICNIQSSLDENRQLLAFSSKQQEEGLQRSLVSVQLVSRAMMDFFNDIHHHASKLVMILDESQIEKSSQLATLKKKFSEESAQEEKLALSNIAAILGTLTSKRKSMFYEALRNIDDRIIAEKKILQQELFTMEQLSDDAKKNWCDHMEIVERNFLEDTFSAAETRATMESSLQECTMSINCSKKLWENMQSSIAHLNQSSISEIESFVEENISTNHSTIEEFACATSSMHEEFSMRACDLVAAVNDSLLLDQETKKEIEYQSTLCLDELRSIQDNHGKNILDLRNQTEQCLGKSYMVDQPTSTTPKKQGITVPSLVSIEEMRTPAFEDLVANMKSLNGGSKWCHTESKTHQQQQQNMLESPNRTPFAAVN